MWNDWRRWVPWRGPATRADRALMAAIGGVIVFGFAMRALRPFLIASHPVLLALLNGGALEIGAAAAFARIGEVPLWLVILAGTVGMVKLDWLNWWAGRRWGPGIIAFFTTRERADRLTARARRLNPWLLCLAVVAAALPGVPGTIVTAAAGWTGMPDDVPRARHARRAAHREPHRRTRLPPRTGGRRGGTAHRTVRGLGHAGGRRRHGGTAGGQADAACRTSRSSLTSNSSSDRAVTSRAPS